MLAATVLIVLILGIFGAHTVMGRTTATDSQVLSGIADFCLDDHHNATDVHAAVVDWRCNGSAAQTWKIAGDTIRHGSDQCLSVLGNGTDASDKIVLDPCNGEAGQQWASAIGGFENPASTLCLAVPGSQTGVQLQLQPCTDLTKADEIWMPLAANSKRPTAGIVSCSTGALGQRVACNAAEQWAAWHSDAHTHTALLNTYTDGNGYEEWCADFVSYLYKQAGDPFTAGERDGWDEYLAENIQNAGNFTMHEAGSYVPQTGDVAFFDYPGGHVEIVAVGGAKPIFIYGDSGTTDPSTNNGEMAENTITSDGDAGQVMYYLSPN